MAQEGQPGWTAGVLLGPIVTAEDPSNRVFVDWDVEGQGDLLGNAWAAPGGIALLHLEDGFNEFFVGPLASGPTPALG